MKPTLSILVTASALALLSACGGSGDDGDGVQPVGPEGLSITSTNQAAVTRAAIAGGLAVTNVETATNDNGGGVQPTNVTARAHSLATIVRHVLTSGVPSRRTIASGSAHPAAASSDTQACTVSGSLSTTFDDRDGNQTLSAGDVITLQFDQCRDSTTSLYNGKAVVTLATVPTAEQITASADFQALARTQGGLTSTVSGTLSVAETDTDTNSNISLTVGSGGLDVTLASTSYNDVVTLDAGLVTTINEIFAAQRSSLTFDGVVQAQSISGGAATLSTPTPLVQLDADAFPSSGVLKAKGLHGTLLMTVLNATTVQLQLDADDDGTYESTSTTTWAALIPQ